MILTYLNTWCKCDKSISRLTCFWNLFFSFESSHGFKGFIVLIHKIHAQYISKDIFFVVFWRVFSEKSRLWVPKKKETWCKSCEGTNVCCWSKKKKKRTNVCCWVFPLFVGPTQMTVRDWCIFFFKSNKKTKKKKKPK